jgi:hypothetical protein
MFSRGSKKSHHGFPQRPGLLVHTGSLLSEPLSTACQPLPPACQPLPRQAWLDFRGRRIWNFCSRENKHQRPSPEHGICISASTLQRLHPSKSSSLLGTPCQHPHFPVRRHSGKHRCSRWSWIELEVCDIWSQVSFVHSSRKHDLTPQQLRTVERAGLTQAASPAGCGGNNVTWVFSAVMSVL